MNQDLVDAAVSAAERARAIEGAATDARRDRDDLIIRLVEAGYTTRWIGGRVGLTATQVSSIWRRDHPARPPGRRPSGGMAPWPERGTQAEAA